MARETVQNQHNPQLAQASKSMPGKTDPHFRTDSLTGQRRRRSMVEQAGGAVVAGLRKSAASLASALEGGGDDGDGSHVKPVKQRLTLMTVHRVSIAARKSLTKVGDESTVLLAQMRTIFLQVLQAEYWNMIASNKIPEGIPVARWLIDSCELALDNVSEPLSDFKYLARRSAPMFIRDATGGTQKKSGAGASRRPCSSTSPRSRTRRSRPGSWTSSTGCGSSSSANISTRSKEQAFLVLISFREAHARALTKVDSFWCSTEEDKAATEGDRKIIAGESKHEVRQANEILKLIDPNLEVAIRTYLVASQILRKQEKMIIAMQTEGMILPGSRDAAGGRTTTSSA
ncbi:potassium:proton antiporter [Aureococcus anophagefferens]|nr:potassium:proton antiporter [Aureococcus anophagefferens]